MSQRVYVMLIQIIAHLEHELTHYYRLRYAEGSREH